MIDSVATCDILFAGSDGMVVTGDPGGFQRPQ